MLIFILWTQLLSTKLLNKKRDSALWVNPRWPQTWWSRDFLWSAATAQVGGKAAAFYQRFFLLCDLLPYTQKLALKQKMSWIWWHILLGRLRQEDVLSLQVGDWPGQHSKTPVLNQKPIQMPKRWCVRCSRLSTGPPALTPFCVIPPFHSCKTIA